MSIEERLVNALSGLMPVASQSYKGEAAEYITTNYTAIPDDLRRRPTPATSGCSYRCITSRPTS